MYGVTLCLQNKLGAMVVVELAVVDLTAVTDNLDASRYI
jgi:hypothetical protein